MKAESKQYQALIQRKADLIAEGEAIFGSAETDARDLTAAEKQRDDAINAELKTLASDIARHEDRLDRVRSMPASDGVPGSAPGFLKHGRGDNEGKALAHFWRTGDAGAARGLMTAEEGAGGKTEFVMNIPTLAESRYQAAAVDSTMNITTAADGKNIVPIGFVRDVVTRKNEIMLAAKLGLRNVPGVGTTVNYPVEGADPTAFAATSEQDDAHAQGYERDAGVTNLKPFTLAKFARKVELTEELLSDNDVNLNAYISDRIGRQMAKAHNTALATEVTTNGTALVTFASASAIAGGEPESILGNDALGYYLADGAGAAWVMRPSTEWAVKALTGNFRLYQSEQIDQANPVSGNHMILGYPVAYSQAVAAVAASAKSMFFGAWYYMGFREDPQLRFIMDPYTVDGLVILKYSFRAVYGVLQAAAIGYAVHPSA